MGQSDIGRRIAHARIGNASRKQGRKIDAVVTRSNVAIRRVLASKAPERLRNRLVEGKGAPYIVWRH